MDRRAFLQFILITSIMSDLKKYGYANSCSKVMNLLPSQEKIIINGTLVNKYTENSVILNLWEKQSEEINQLYRYVHHFFSEDSNRTYATLSEDMEFQHLLSVTDLDLFGGPMLGDVSDNSVSIWLRTLKPSVVFIKYWSERGIKFESEHLNTTKASDLSTTILLKDLEPNTKYMYEVYVNGHKLSLDDRILHFRTPTKDLSKVKTRIVFGSCYHRWGLGNSKLTDLILSREPSAFLLMGDVAVQDKLGNAALHRDDYFLRDLIPAWRRLVSVLPIYYTWDDHDYMDNDLAGIPEGMSSIDQENIWRVCRFAWNNPYYGFGESGKGLFFHSTIGPVDIIMIDNRYFRKKGSFLGEGQMQWLEKQLLACRSSFIILSCGTMWSDFVSGGKDSWGEIDPEGRERIFQLIEKHNIKGVLLISGDRHGARGFAIPRPSGFSFYEFGGASLGARSGPPAKKSEWTTQLYGISGEFAFSEFEFGELENVPIVTFRLIHENGTFIYERAFTRDELSVK